MSLTPRNWVTFQHYKDRKPSWIKLHHALLDDYQFACLPVASRALAPCLWLLASEYEAGEITAPLDEIAFRLHMTLDELCKALAPLVEAKFFIAINAVPICSAAASVLLAEPEQLASPEREREKEIEIQEKTERERERGVVALRAPARADRGTRLATDWQPDATDYKFATSQGLRLFEIDVEATKYRNYWTAKAGKEARKVDWPRTWQNWILNVKGNGNGPRGSRPLQNGGKQHPSDLALDLAEQARELERQAGISR